MLTNHKLSPGPLASRQTGFSVMLSLLTSSGHRRPKASWGNIASSRWDVYVTECWRWRRGPPKPPLFVACAVVQGLLLEWRPAKEKAQRDTFNTPAAPDRGT